MKAGFVGEKMFMSTDLEAAEGFEWESVSYTEKLHMQRPWGQGEA